MLQSAISFTVVGLIKTTFRKYLCYTDTFCTILFEPLNPLLVAWYALRPCRYLMVYYDTIIGIYSISERYTEVVL